MPSSLAYVPGLHMDGAVAPVLHAAPSGHGVHSSAEARPALLLKVPAKHGKGALLPSPQYEPGSHGVQLSCAASGWYVPAPQLVHWLELALGATEPAGHSTGCCAPTLHAWPGGQVWQPDCDERPVSLPKLPAEHSVAAIAPRSQ